jgi:hypothetical protein
MRRREFITGFVAMAGWPFDVRAQRTPLRAGFLPLGSPENGYDRSLVELFRQGLRDVGVVEDRDIVLDIAWIGDETEIPRALTDLIKRGAGLLIPCGTSASVAAKRLVSTIPILFIDVFGRRHQGARSRAAVEQLHRPALEQWQVASGALGPVLPSRQAARIRGVSIPDRVVAGCSQGGENREPPVIGFTRPQGRAPRSYRGLGLRMNRTDVTMKVARKQ